MGCAGSRNDTKVTRLQQDASWLREENSSLKQENASLKQQSSQKDNKISRLQQDDTRLREENASLKQENASLKQQISQKDSEISRLQLDSEISRLQQVAGRRRAAEGDYDISRFPLFAGGRRAADPQPLRRRAAEGDCEISHDQQVARRRRAAEGEAASNENIQCSGQAVETVSIEKIQLFLSNTLPNAYSLLEKAKQHGVHSTSAIERKLGDLNNAAIKVKELVEQLEAKKVELEAKKVELEISTVGKTLDMTKWLRDDLAESMAYEFKVVVAKKLRDWKGGPLPHHQEFTSKLGVGCLQTLRVSVRDLFSDSDLLKRLLVVSHRWVRAGSPDPEGQQQAIIIEYLNSHREIEFVWLDWWCIPQGSRSPEEQSFFEKTLEHVYMLFLGAQVLLLLDMQFLGRFWTSYETWLSMRQVSEEGFSSCDDRVTIRCLGAAGVMEQSLRDTWGPLSIDQAHTNLSYDDIVVTNKRDKAQQLKVLRRLERDLPALLTILSEASQERWSFLSVDISANSPGKANLLKLGQPLVIQDHNTLTIIHNGTTDSWSVMFADPLPTNKPTCLVITYSFSTQPGYWIAMGVQYERRNKEQVDYYCDYAFDSYHGYTGGNTRGSCSNVTFPGGSKPSMVNGDMATLLFEPAKRRLLLLKHKTNQAFAFKDLDISRPLHLHVSTWKQGNSLSLRLATGTEFRFAQTLTEVAAVSAAAIPIN